MSNQVYDDNVFSGAKVFEWKGQREVEGGETPNQIVWWKIKKTFG